MFLPIGRKERIMTLTLAYLRQIDPIFLLNNLLLFLLLALLVNIGGCALLLISDSLDPAGFCWLFIFLLLFFLFGLVFYVHEEVMVFVGDGSRRLPYYFFTSLC